MENLIYLLIALALIAVTKSIFFKSSQTNKITKNTVTYHYGRKDYIMTESEHNFFMILNRILQDKYHVFPQVHLSSLLDERKVKGQNYG